MWIQSERIYFSWLMSYYKPTLKQFSHEKKEYDLTLSWNIIMFHSNESTSQKMNFACTLSFQYKCKNMHEFVFRFWWYFCPWWWPIQGRWFGPPSPSKKLRTHSMDPQNLLLINMELWMRIPDQILIMLNNKTIKELWRVRFVALDQSIDRL